METLTIEIRNPKAKKLIEDLVDLDLISLLSSKPSWNLLWEKLDTMLPQVDSGISEQDVLNEIQAYRLEKKGFKE
ncbi:MAG TPA: hypothetical protein VK175_09875 [Leadbetterella sp.]|jgi:hypothetical protein|nr:hypothetical protein [Leadbetterella sp.]